MYRRFLLALLMLALLLAFLVLKPFLHTVILTMLLAGLSYPLHRILTVKLGNPSLSALTVVLLDTIVIVIPFGLFFFLISARVVDTMNSAVGWIREGHLEELLRNPWLTGLSDFLGVHFDIKSLEGGGLREQLTALSKWLGQYALTYGAGFLGMVVSSVVDFFITLFLLFYFLRDGRKMLTIARGLTPLKEEQEERILEKIDAVTKSVVYGGFLTALCQGVAAGVGMAIAGIPAIFWGTITAFASFLPVVGSAMVWVPMAVWLLIGGRTAMAIFLLVWCVAVVGTIDNFVRPFFMRGKAQMSPFFIFLAILGGMAYFGLKGLLYGPLIVSFAAIMLSLYQREYQEVLSASEHGYIAKMPDQ